MRKPRIFIAMHYMEIGGAETETANQMTGKRIDSFKKTKYSSEVFSHN